MLDESVFMQPVLKGKKIFNPDYIEQEVDEYNGNQLIEALPPIFSDDEITNHLYSDIIISEKEKSVRPNVKYHFINRIKDFYMPMDNLYKMEHKLSSAIRRGYLARNPMSKEYCMRLNLLSTMREFVENKKDINPDEVCYYLAQKFDTIPETRRSSAECASAIGVSGMGKSESNEKILLMYPQVIYHHMYHEIPLTRTQIVWLKIDCPFDGSLKTLCKLFF